MIGYNLFWHIFMLACSGYWADPGETLWMSSCDSVNDLEEDIFLLSLSLSFFSLLLFLINSWNRLLLNLVYTRADHGKMSWRYRLSHIPIQIELGNTVFS